MSIRGSEDVRSSRLPAQTTLGPLHLVVRDIERSVSFYTEAVGLEIGRRDAGLATLGVGGTRLLVLHEEPGAQPSTSTSGLFHLALRVPTRGALAAWLRHASRDGVQLTGLSDHFVSEAIYLSDPDAHGIEIYWDAPRSLWEGRVAERMTTMPLDTASLLRELPDDESVFVGLPEGTDLGHVHLRVGSLPAAVSFYGELLGFETMGRIPEAAFLGAGGYHHHLGLNTWQSRGASAVPAGFARIDHLTIVVPGYDAVAAAAERFEAAGVEVEALPSGIRLHDPFGVSLVLTADDAQGHEAR